MHMPCPHPSAPALLCPALLLCSKWMLEMKERREYERRNETIAARQSLEQQFGEEEGEGGGGSSGDGGSGDSGSGGGPSRRP